MTIAMKDYPADSGKPAIDAMHSFTRFCPVGGAWAPGTLGMAPKHLHLG